ncbi:MAG: hypothetical protein ACOX6W_16300 [Lentisphaeria bacterium]
MSLDYVVRHVCRIHRRAAARDAATAVHNVHYVHHVHSSKAAQALKTGKISLANLHSDIRHIFYYR